MPTAEAPLVAIVMGSDSDLPVMAECARVLESYGVSYEARVLSAHRTPDEAVRFAREAEDRGLKLIVAGAGGAAHLAGVIAAHSLLPVIGVPLDGTPLSGFDALLATVQMPPGIPVATMAIGAMGAKNAGHLAVAILALQDSDLRARLREARERVKTDVAERSQTLSKRLRDILSGQ